MDTSAPFVDPGETVEQTPAGEVTARKAMPRPPPLDVGGRIGRYVLVGPLGMGGMGMVYRAYDPKLQREVALKRLRADASAERGEARMIREARAMAQLSHPNVVAVYDVEDSDGELTLAMELVEGRTLHEWLDKEHRVAQILTVLVEAGRGLAAAHAAGLVHRDFKPANVLVTTDGVAKVTDFGLAKGRGLGAAADPSADGSTITPELELTQAGTVLGTPVYMAPEQLEGATPDARTDQYAFCVTAWRALFGGHPHRGDGATLASAKKRGPPPAPRTPGVSRRVADALRRGLAPDPGDRFAAMEPLLAALVPSDGRWRWWLGAGVIALVAVAAVFAWRDPRVDPCAQWDHALGEPWSPEHAQAITAAFEASELPYATATARRAVERLDAYAGAWGGQRRRLCEAEPARAEDGPTDDATLRAACYERARDGLGAAVEVLQTADADLVARAHSVVDGLPPLEHCADVDALRAEAMAWPGEDPGEAIAALSAEQARAAAWLEAGRFADAARVARAARDSAVAHDAVAVQAQLEWVLARAQARLGDDAAETTFRSGLAAALRARADHLVAEIALDFAFHLANDLYRVDEARQLSEIGAAIAERPRTGVRLRAEAASIAGTVDQVAGRLHPAAAHHRRALEIRSEHLGSAHLDVAVSRTNLGLVLFRLGEHEAAIAEHRAALDIRRRALGEEHPEVAGVRNNLAIALEADGQYEEAEAEQRASLAASIAWFGPRHRSVAKSYNNLAIVLHSIGRDEEAAEAAERAIEIFTERVGERSAELAFAYNTLGLARDARGDLRGAASDFARAAEIAEDVLEPDQPVLGRIWANLADARSRLGEHESAESLARRALDLRRRQLGPEHGETAGAYARLAEVLYAAGRNDDAHAEAERLWAIVESGKVRPWLRVKAALLLVRGLATRDLDRARRIARETLERTDVGVASRDEVVAWLDAHG